MIKSKKIAPSIYEVEYKGIPYQIDGEDRDDWALLDTSKSYFDQMVDTYPTKKAALKAIESLSE